MATKATAQETQPTTKAAAYPVLTNGAQINGQALLEKARAQLINLSAQRFSVPSALMFKTVGPRALSLWRHHLTPRVRDMDVEQFERSLVKVNMRAGQVIPWVLASGCACGLASHSFAGGAPQYRERAAVISGLSMFILGLCDYMENEFPAIFAEVQDRLTSELLTDCVYRQEYYLLGRPVTSPVAQGLLAIYRVYFELCHEMMAAQADEGILNRWFEVLCTKHLAEVKDGGRQEAGMTRSIATTAEQIQTTSWVVAASTCLADGVSVMERSRHFAELYGRLNWAVRDIADLEKNLRQKRESALAMHLETEPDPARALDKVFSGAVGECAELVHQMYDMIERFGWQPEDAFSLADVHWGYLWASLGGQAAVEPA